MYGWSVVIIFFSLYDRAAAVGFLRLLVKQLRLRAELAAAFHEVFELFPALQHAVDGVVEHVSCFVEVSTTHRGQPREHMRMETDGTETRRSPRRGRLSEHLSQGEEAGWATYFCMRMIWSALAGSWYLRSCSSKGGQLIASLRFSVFHPLRRGVGREARGKKTRLLGIIVVP